MTFACLSMLETQSWWRAVVILLQMHISSEDDSLEGRGSGAHHGLERSSCFPRAAVYCHEDQRPQERKRDLVWGLRRLQACNS